MEQPPMRVSDRHESSAGSTAAESTVPAAAQPSRAPGGPLAGVRVVELAGIGPGPYACMMLADMGADVVQVRRPGDASAMAADPMMRSRRCLALDLKNAAAVDIVL